MSETLREAVARAILEDRKPSLRWQDFDHEAACALKAIHQWLTEHGWAVVPREPSPAMKAIDAALAPYWDESTCPPTLTSKLGSHTGASWQDMIACAPASPLMEEGR